MSNRPKRRIPPSAFAAVVLATAVASAAEAPARIREFPVPTPGALPHDPAVAPDGALWTTEQRANKLGRLDVGTGQFREYPLTTPDSGPHGLVVDGAGAVWFTASYKGYVGQLDPQTGKVREFRWSDTRARDPHTPALDPAGVVWFTVQQSNLIGRLDPRTGTTRFIDVPTPNALPYGMVIGADGAPYFCEFGSNKIGRVDPAEMSIRELVLPEGARPRRIALARDGTLYYSDYARGMLGHLDPASGKVEEWRSPGGPGSRPYGIASTSDGVVWYSESGVQPNTLVRFDPATRRFEVMPIPSGGGVVRNLVATPQGQLYLACSGANRVAVAVPAGSRASR
jgi:virginiamycin B lyase